MDDQRASDSCPKVQYVWSRYGRRVRLRSVTLGCSLLSTILAVFLWVPTVSEPIRLPELANHDAAAKVSASQPAENSSRVLPDAPLPKVVSVNAEDAGESSSLADAALEPGFRNAAVKPAGRAMGETKREKAIWMGLIVGGHSAAVFDAYTTRRAISGGYGTEGDPLLRPFAQSNAMYLATQVSPLVMDYLGHRMMTSNNKWLHKFWWVPQSAGMSVSLAAGVHNYRIVPR